ncbi:helix-turn-helix domain-containing protein [uncultured Ruegeria sp.]|nr:helix-turn-helix domain-containing protein [uncultured Ruegeria sp.]
MAKAQIARDLGVARMTVYRALAEIESETEVRTKCASIRKPQK